MDGFPLCSDRWIQWRHDSYGGLHFSPIDVLSNETFAPLFLKEVCSTPFRLGSTWGKWQKEVSQSNSGISVVSLGSAACGNATAVLFPPLCKNPSFSLFGVFFKWLKNSLALAPDYDSRYVVDAADPDNLSVSKSELHDLLSKTSLSGIPLLVLGNKIDRPGALSKDDLTEEM